MIDKTKILAGLRGPKTRRYGLRFLIAVAVVGVLGFFVLPPIVKSVLLDQLGAALHRKVTVERVYINPYTLAVQVDGVAIHEREGVGSAEETVAGFDSLYLNLQLSSLLRGGPVFSEIRLAGPRLKVVRLPDRSYNFSDLIDEFMARPESTDPTPRFSLNNIQIAGGRLEFDDRVLDEKHAIGDIVLTLPFISSLPNYVESFVEPAFSATIDGAPLALTGRSKPFADSRESELALDLDKLQLAQYFDYLPVQVPVKLASASLDSDLKLVFREEQGQPSTLTVSGRVALNDVALKESGGAPLASLRRLEVDLGALDLLKRNARIERVVLDTPVLHARATPQGTLNWLDLLPKAPATPEKTAPAAAQPAFAWSLGEASVKGGALQWLDESRGKAVRASVEGIDATLKHLDSQGEKAGAFDFAWRVSAGDWLKVDALAIKGGQINLAKRELLLGEVTTRGVRVQALRGKDGVLDWIEPPALRAQAPAGKNGKEAGSRAGNDASWKVTVAKYHAEDVALRFEDKSIRPATIHTVQNLTIDAENLSTAPGTTAQLSTRFGLNKKGEVAVSGKLRPFPLDADLALDLKAIELLPLQPYFTQRLNVSVTRGQLTLKGALQVHERAGKEGKDGKEGYAGGFSGQATIGDFHAVDKINSADFLKWKSFYFGHIDARLNPDSLTVGDIALADFFARVIVSPEGKLNLLQIVRRDEAAPTPVVPAPAPDAAPATKGEGKASAPVAEKAAPPMPIRIGKVTLQGGSVNFSDNFVKPNYSANLRQIGGQLSGLSSAPDSVATLDLRGSYDDVAPLTVKARLNPLAAKPYLDLDAEVKGIELTPFSPYSGKYAGYAIEKGKLSLFVKYKIENDQLQAENRVFLDQLTFGDPVESAEATKLPVKLALALLKNRQGEIDINLPISGSLSDPEFSIGGLVVKVIVNLFVKAVTSPFALLGSLFGGGEELSYLEFDAGRNAITPAGQQRLETLAKALNDRPSLKLEIDGRVDVERDREGLKRALMEGLVRTQKRNDMVRKGVEAGSADDVVVEAKEYPALLARAYRAEKFPKPRNLVGLVKDLPVEEMEKLILTNITVSDDDLRALATRRAQVVRDWLVSRAGVPSERIFLLPAKLEAPADKVGAADDKAKAKASRVDFSLK